jgi:hypothetical protein
MLSHANVILGPLKASGPAKNQSTHRLEKSRRDIVDQIQVRAIQ